MNVRCDYKNVFSFCVIYSSCVKQYEHRDGNSCEVVLKNILCPGSLTNVHSRTLLQNEVLPWKQLLSGLALHCLIHPL
jgi:hypothetical protein